MRNKKIYKKFHGKISISAETLRNFGLSKEMANDLLNRLKRTPGINSKHGQKLEEFGLTSYYVLDEAIEILETLVNNPCPRCNNKKIKKYLDILNDLKINIIEGLDV